jgi:hypothetical protein
LEKKALEITHMKINGHNSYPKFALPNQNAGDLTPAQAAQSKRDKLRHAQEEKWQMPVKSSHIISFLPHSIIHDPGTLTPVEDLKHTDVSPKYSRSVHGPIVAMQPCS